MFSLIVGVVVPSLRLFMMITEARDVGAVFVAASGNNYGNDNDTRPFYPSSYDVDNIVSVASIDKKNRLSSFSNKGPKR